MAESERMKKRKRVNLKVDKTTFKALHIYIGKKRGRTVQNVALRAVRELLAREGVIRLKPKAAKSEQKRSPLDSEGSPE